MKCEGGSERGAGGRPRCWPWGPMGLVVAIMVRDHASATILSGIPTQRLRDAPPELTFSRADELITLFSGRVNGPGHPTVCGHATDQRGRDGEGVGVRAKSMVA